jgi:hypothetical protein
VIYFEYAGDILESDVDNDDDSPYVFGEDGTVYRKENIKTV